MTTPTLTATREAIRTTRAALREVEDALRSGDHLAAAMAAERAAGAASVVWSDAEDRLAASTPTPSHYLGGIIVELPA